MSFNNQQQPKVQLELVGQGVANALIDALKSDARVGGSATSQKLLVSNASDFLKGSETNNLNNLLRSGQSLLLLDVSEQDKESLKSQIGFSSPGDSQAYLVTAKPGVNNRLIYYIWDLPKSVEAISEMNDAGGEGSYDEAQLTGNSENVSISKQKAQSIEHAFANDVLSCLTDQSRVSASQATVQPEQQQWIYNQTLNWSCSSRSEEVKVTPQAQNTYITVTFTFIVYLDEEASGKFQWLYLEVLGYQSVGSTNMNQNGNDEKGWANGFVNVQIPTPSGFSVYQSSPNNVNNSTTYTSEVSMQIGVSADVSAEGPSAGANASVSVSHSTTKTITDWALQQNDVNNWTFYQQNPWDARQYKWQDDMILYDAAHARHEIKPLPSLSTGVMNFDTMSVWKNNAVSLNHLSVTINLGANWNYIGLQNIWPSWKGYWWGTKYGMQAFTFSIDLSMVS